MPLLKQISARLPHRWQTELKRLHFARQISQDRFATPEPEFRLAEHLVRPGDWVLDIGANIGHYTRRFSTLVGPEGRVIAFEPVPTTFSILAANVELFAHRNVSLVNAAASDTAGVVGMSIPKFSTGLDNYYEAHVSSDTSNALSVLTLPIDSLQIEHRIALVKIDAEGHEAAVLAGMQQTIRASRPIMIVETSSPEVISGLIALGYTQEHLPDSPNMLFRPSA